ncbi:unnamed protein product, partial [Adineta steineri]
MDAAPQIYADKSDALTQQLIEEAKKNLGLNVDQSKIQVTKPSEENDDIIVSVPLVDTVKTTNEELKQNDIYVSYQCMDTEKLKGCFKVKLTNANEKEAEFALVDNEGNIIASKTATATTTSSGTPESWIICIWVNGVFQGDMNHNQQNFLYSLKPLTSIQLPDNSQIITTFEIKEIYDKIIQLQTKITDNVSQWDTTERQEFWLSIMNIWIELTKQSADITYNNLYLLTDCFNRISVLWQQCVESKSIIDINDNYTIEKAFSSCLMMLDISHIHNYLCKIDEISNETIVPFNVHLIL